MRLPANPTCVLVQMQATTLVDSPVYRRMSRHSFGSVAVSRILSVPQSVDALLDEVPPYALESTQVQLVRTGRLILEQGDEQTEYAAGDVAVYDASRPFRFLYPEPFTTTILQVPTHLLSTSAPSSALRLAPGTTGRSALDGILRASPWAEPSLADPDALSESVVEALRLVTAESREESPLDATRARSDALRRAVLEDLHRVHRDPTATVASIAARLGVSLRSVHAAFEDRPEAPGAVLRRFRLSTAGSLMLTTDLPIAEIAARSGYRDVTAFIRAWAASTGTTPARWRRDRLGRGTASGAQPVDSGGE